MKKIIKNIFQKLSILLLRVWGWKIIGELPKIDKYVAIVAPHRAGAGDVVRGLLTKTIQSTPPVKFPAKIEIMQVPLVGHFLSWIGGVPVDRKHTKGGPEKGVVTKELIDSLILNHKAVVALAPEGTREVGARWRMGFYQITNGASVPLVMVAFDYKRKIIWISEPLSLTGNKAIDIASIKDWYKLVVPEYEIIIFEKDI